MPERIKSFANASSAADLLLVMPEVDRGIAKEVFEGHELSEAWLPPDRIMHPATPFSRPNAFHSLEDERQNRIERSGQPADGEAPRHPRRSHPRARTARRVASRPRQTRRRVSGSAARATRRTEAKECDGADGSGGELASSDRPIAPRVAAADARACGVSGAACATTPCRSSTHLQSRGTRASTASGTRRRGRDS